VLWRMETSVSTRPSRPRRLTNVYTYTYTFRMRLAWPVRLDEGTTPNVRNMVSIAEIEPCFGRTAVLLHPTLDPEDRMIAWGRPFCRIHIAERRMAD